MSRVVITADCVSDLNDELRKKYSIPTIPYYVATDHGRFKDMDEISSRNVIEYFMNGGEKISTQQPSAAEYEAFFSRFSQRGEELVHFCLGSGISLAYQIASETAKKFDGRVHVFDSENLSAGMGIIVMRAVELAEKGCSAKEILKEVDRMKYRVSTTFIVKNAEYLFRNGRVSKNVCDFCKAFNVHPVMEMRKGKIRLNSLRFGNYEKAVLRYVRRQLWNPGKISKKRAFITHTNCSLKVLSEVKKLTMKRCNFENLYVTEASATITSNCGEGTIGILVLRE